MKRLRRVALWVLALIAAVLITSALVRPSNQRDWLIDQAILPSAEFSGSQLTIRNLRNFRYDSTGAPIPDYDDRTYDLDRIETVWFVLAPFEPERRGPAHSFLSFGFADSQYVAVSVEARREKGEAYSLLKGLLKRFELMYVIGDERDLIQLRTNHRGDEVYVYPIRTSPEKARQLFVEMLERANQLQRDPEFYNTLTNNCTTNILDHVNRVTTNKIRWGREVLLPGYADELALRLGLIDDDGTLEQVRARYLVNERAKRFADAYWALGRPLETVQRSLQNSLCFGVYQGDRQIGLARVITDYATYGYLCDVYVIDEYRGRGLGVWLIGCVLRHPGLQSLRKFSLTTRDAQELYRRFGFTEVTEPQRYMNLRPRE
jgi:ribosomal protein S18 acetylase RimI-like enzyme